MDRKGHYLRPGTRSTQPGVIFGVIVHADVPTARHSAGWQVQSWHSAHVCVMYRARDKWSAPQECYVTTPDALREWISERAARRRINWVIAPVASEALTLSKWWEYAESQGINLGMYRDPADGDDRSGDLAAGVHIDTLHTSARCDIVAYRERGVRYRWVSARNYGWDDGTIGRSGDSDTSTGERQQGQACASSAVSGGSQAIALASRLRDLGIWYGRIAQAPLGTTCGQLAWGVLRSRAPARTLCTHSDADCHRLERASAHGGRASIWYIGHVGGRQGGDSRVHGGGTGLARAHISGPIYHVDVRSMYPWILRDRSYPVKLCGYSNGGRPADIIELAAGLGVIARVRIESERAEFPQRYERGVRYPVGRFTTYLTGPELIELSKCGEIIKVYEYALYKLARPFTESMDALLSDRESCRERGDAAGEQFAKLVANSLAGKLAQRQGRWKRDAHLDETGKWGDSHVLNRRTGTVTRIRHLCGLAWRWVDDESGSGPHTAAFAYLTSYGRLHMAAIRAAMPPLSVVSQDTDGLWCTEEGYHSLISAGILGHGGVGQLRTVGSARTAIFLGARHYCTDGQWTLAGYCDPVVDQNTGRVLHSQHTPLFQAGCVGPPGKVFVATHDSLLPADLEDGIVGEDGWVRPRRLLSRWREDEL